MGGLKGKNYLHNTCKCFNIDLIPVNVLLKEAFSVGTMFLSLKYKSSLSSRFGSYSKWTPLSTTVPFPTWFFTIAIELSFLSE